MHNPEKIEKLAMDIRQLLLKHKLWDDIYIYYNGLRLSDHDKTKGKSYPNEDVLCISEEEYPEDYVPNAPSTNHILSMMFEGTFCGIINFYNSSPESEKIREEFSDLLRKNGLYFEQYNHYTLTCYEN